VSRLVSRLTYGVDSKPLTQILYPDNQMSHSHPSFATSLFLHASIPSSGVLRDLSSPPVVPLDLLCEFPVSIFYDLGGSKDPMGHENDGRG
jgi:hypothetical protein